MSCWRVGLSTLLATSSVGTFRRRNISANLSSSSVTPEATSTTMSTASASSIARSDCLLTFSSSEEPPGVHPPVSTMMNSWPEPFRRQFLAVTRNARILLDDRRPPPDDAVEQGRLANVRTADDGYYRRRRHRLTATPAQPEGTRHRSQRSRPCGVDHPASGHQGNARRSDTRLEADIGRQQVSRRGPATGHRRP